MKTASFLALEATAAVCQARRARLLEHAHTQGLAGVLVFGHGSSLGSGTRSHGAMRFLSDWDGHDAMSFLVCTRKACTLLVGSPFLVPLARLKHPDLTVLDAPPHTWSQRLASLLDGVPSVATVGFDEVPQGVWHRLQAAPPLQSAVSLDAWLDEARSVLDTTQQAAHRQAAAICDELFQGLGRELRRGVPAWCIQAALTHRAHELGADHCRTWLTVGTSADYPRYWKEEGSRIPQPNDQVLFGIMLTVDGHWGHGIRMGHMGQANPAIQAMHSRCLQALNTALGALSEGAPLSDVEAAMQAVLPSHAAPSNTCFRYGHGLGHSYEEAHATASFPQWFGAAEQRSPPAPTRARAGNLLELHPNIFVDQVGGAAVGEMVLVHETHNECLLTYPTGLADWS